MCAAVLAMHSGFKLYHWATASYSRHMATDELVDALAEHGDKLIEALIASNDPTISREGRPALSAVETLGDPISKESRPGSDATPEMLDGWADRYILACIQFWTAPDPAAGPAARALTNDLAVRSIADDIIAALRKAQYLFSFQKYT
jgi:hypothetical protein